MVRRTDCEGEPSCQAYDGANSSSVCSAALSPLAAHAQQMRSPYRIGFLGLLPGENTSTSMKSLLERLNELGYREGDNMIFDYRSAEGTSERLPQLAADAVRASPRLRCARSR